MTPENKRTIRILAIVLSPVAGVATWLITSSFGFGLLAAFVALPLVGLYAQIRYDLPGEDDGFLGGTDTFDGI